MQRLKLGHTNELSERYTNEFALHNAIPVEHNGLYVVIRRARRGTPPNQSKQLA